MKVIEPVFERDGGQRCAVLCKLEGRDTKGWVWLKEKGGKLKLEESREHKLKPQRSEEAEAPLCLPLEDRTFSKSNFRDEYKSAAPPEGPWELGAMLHQLIAWYCRKHKIPWKEEGHPFLKDLQKEAMEGENAQELVKEISEAAQRVWTSAKVLRGREFCFILNEAVRDDEAADATAVIARAINKLCVTIPPRPPFPPGNVCFRGGGFDNKHRSFYKTNQEFRQPAFLATSFSEAVADGFIHRVPRKFDKVKWLIHIHPQHRCHHVNLVKRTNVPGEEEYLFAAYSAFTVKSVAWNAGTDASPHRIELVATVDNKKAREDLPLAPWS